MDKIKVLVVDDNKDSIEIIEFFLSQMKEFEVVGTCGDGHSLIGSVITLKPDLIISDIDMPGKNGMEAIKECLQFDPLLNFIFVTCFDSFAVEAFSVSAIDYIVKPIEMGRFYSALTKVKAKMKDKQGSTNKRLQIKHNGSIYIIPFEEIVYIEKNGKKSHVYTTKDTFQTYENLGDLMVQLDDSFFLSHRSYIINLKKVSHITPKNETFIAYFLNFESYAHVSKLRISELQEKLGLTS